jgi:glycosyltransferase involved in cell wall biosynthesis
VADLLLINARLPWPLNDGNALRVLQLVRHLSPEHRCHLVSFNGDDATMAELKRQQVFSSITMLPPFPRRHWSRIFRRDDRDYYRRSYPGHFRHVTGLLQQIIDREKVTTVVPVLLRTEEFTRELRGVRRVIDEYDCLTLAMERELAARQGMGPWERLRRLRRLKKARAAEAALADTCDAITAIAPPDVARLRSLNGDRIPVELVPNGVDAALLERPLPASSGSERAVAFWGNMAFSVNQLAVDWFYRKVWLPFLQPQHVAWIIVGPNPGAPILDLSRRHPEISVPGFVDDLFGCLDPYPVMVNPMVSGTGLKNKVLEAFAVGKAVVSTPLGMEAFPVQDGEHFILANTPEAFGAAVLRLLDDPAERARLAARSRQLAGEHYSWGAAAARWETILFQSGGDQSG